MWTEDRIRETVQAHEIVVFGKGTREAPQCGFTMRAIQILTACEAAFEVVNIFEDESIRPALVGYSGWPTTPQIFVGGEFIGGSDVALELYQSGELQNKVAAALGETAGSETAGSEMEGSETERSKEG